MSAAPFALESCVRTKTDGTDQHGWVVVRVFPDDRREPLHEPWFGVYSKHLANSFLDGVLLMWFMAKNRPRCGTVPDRPQLEQPTRRTRTQEFQFS